MPPLDATLKVYMAFGDNFNEASPTWTEITAYVRSCRIDRGRQHELNRMEAGRCWLTLDNANRRFEPEYTSGAYNPDILPMVPVKVEAVYNSITYGLFRGFVESWPQRWPNVKDAVVPVVCVDGFKVFALASTRNGTVAGTIGDESPFSYWRLQEPSGTTVNDTGSDANNGLYQGTHTLGQPGPVYGSSFGVDVVTDGIINMGAPNGSFDAAASWTLVMWVKLNSTGVSHGLFRMDSGNLIRFSVTSGNLLELRVHTSIVSSGALVVTGATQLGTDWVHVAAKHSAGANTIEVFYNGQSDGSESSTLSGALTEDFRVGHNTLGGYADARFAEVALFDAAVTDARINSIFSAQISDFVSEVSSTRVGNLLDMAQWPTADRNLDTGDSTLIAVADPSGSDALALLLLTADSELGVFFIDGSGDATFHKRTHRNALTSQATFSDDGSDHRYTDLVLSYDDDLLFTQVTVTPAGGTPNTKRDNGQAALYGVRDLQRTGLWVTAAEAGSMARTLETWHSVPNLRVERIVFQPQTDPVNMWPDALGLEIGEMITVERTPPGGGAQISADVFIERITHTMQPDRWVTAYQLSPDVANPTY